MQSEIHPQERNDLSANLCIAAAIIVLYNGIDLSFFSQNLTQSPFWVLRPLAWSMIFGVAALGITGAIASVGAPHPAGNPIRIALVRFALPLVAAVAVAALVIGPLATTAPLRLYFRDRAFLAYWANCVGVPRFTLPGVFQNSLVPQTVNANLWAVPFLAAFCLLAFALTGRLRLQRIIALLFAVALLIAEFVAGSRDLRIFEAAGLVRGEGIGMPATALLSGFCALGLSGTRFADYLAKIPRLLLLLYCAGIGALFARGQLESPIVTIAIAIAAILLVLPHRRASESWTVTAPLLPVFVLFSYPVQQLIEMRLRESVNGYLLVAAPIAALIVVTLTVSRPLARIAGGKTAILAIWDLRQLSADPNERFSCRRRFVVLLPVLAISIAMVLLFLAVIVAVTPPKVGI